MSGPREDFAAYVEWVLVNNGMDYTVSPKEDTTSPTHVLPAPEMQPSPEFSQPSPREMDMMPKLLADTSTSHDE